MAQINVRWLGAELEKKTVNHPCSHECVRAHRREGERRRLVGTKHNPVGGLEAFKQIQRGFPSGSVVKNPPANTGDTGFSPWVEKIPWRRKWQPTPLFLPGKSHGQRSLVGYSPWGCKESDTAAAAAKSLQSCPTLCDPVDCSPPGFSVHGILQARTLKWVRHYLGTKQQQTNPTVISPLHTSLQIANFQRLECVFGSNKETRTCVIRSGMNEISAGPPSPTEKAMAPHSCTLAWKIPWMEEPGRLQSMGSLRVGHD